MVNIGLQFLIIKGLNRQSLVQITIDVKLYKYFFILLLFLLIYMIRLSNYNRVHK